jgi:CubicO group peptidase (beta-lactamase class C family)
LTGVRIVLVFLLLSIGCVSTPAAQTDLLLRRYAMYGMSANVLVSKNNQIVLNSNYGVQERHFDAGSIMKTVTAAAILELQRDRKLDVQDAISKYLPQLPPDRGAITIHQLLLHTSGLPLDVQNGDPLNTPLVSKPGEKYSYSNAGYGLLALIVEKAAGRPFIEYARERLIAPAGMTETYFWSEPLPPMATPFTGNSDEELTPAEPLVRNDPTSPMWGKYVFGAAGLITTARDLHRWWQFIDRRPEHFVEHIDGQSYGWNVRRQPDGTLRHYRGGFVRASFMSMLSAYRRENVVLIWLMNKNTGWHEPLTKNFERILAKETPAIPPAVVRGRDALANEYASGNARILITRDDDDLLLAAEGQEALSIVWALGHTHRAAQMNEELAKKDAGYEVLGSGGHPSSKDNLQTFVRHNGEILRFISNGEKILATGKGYPPSAQRRFRRTGKETYALYDPKRDAIVTLTVKGNEATLAFGEKTVTMAAR